MKILQVITCSSLGGAQSVVACLANALSESNEVVVAAGEGDGKFWETLAPAVKREPLTALRRSLSLKHDTLALWQLRQLWRKYHPDVVHLHSSKAGMLGRVVFPSSRVVYTVHGFDSIRLAYRRFLPIERLMQRRCTAIVGVSDYDERNLRSEGIIRNVSRIYNGIPVPSVSDANLSWSVPEGYERYVLCIARLTPPKNSSLFLAAARLLPHYAFVWIGNQYEVRDESLPTNVFFMGNLPNARRYLTKADLFILPSNYEGLPMVIIEAMACGLPVVASNVGGISEIVHNEENGYVVENSPTAFATHIEKILSDDEKIASFSQKSRECYDRDLTAEKMVNGYLHIYNGIANRK